MAEHFPFNYPVISVIEPGEILDRAKEKKSGGWRLMELHANRPYKDNKLELVYSYCHDTGHQIELLTTYIEPDQAVESVSHVFPCAFVFENEMHDLFGVQVNNLLLDYQGQFYRVLEGKPMLNRPEDSKPKARAAAAGSSKGE